MLQRIQSVFLFFAALCMLGILFFPVWQKVEIEKNETVVLTALDMKYQKMDIESGTVSTLGEEWTGYIAILAVFAAAIALYSVFRYDNRLFQVKLGALNSLLMGGTLGVSVYFMMEGEKIIAPLQRGEMGVGFYLGVAALLFNSMANRFIRKDEKLVRSADRIR